MEQKKIGAFMKELRREKGMTQENLAEVFGVSARTVSRWETGFNMPDLDILMQMSDYYDVDIRELLDGERKSENMNKELEETVLKAVDYTNSETEQYIKRVHWLLLVGVMLWAFAQLISRTSLIENNVVSGISDFAEGAACGMVLCGFIVTSRYGQRIKAFKQRMLKR